jgi:hypothetical protein
LETFLAGFNVEIHQPQVTEFNTPIEKIKTLKNPRNMAIQSSFAEQEIQKFTKNEYKCFMKYFLQRKWHIKGGCIIHPKIERLISVAQKSV